MKGIERSRHVTLLRWKKFWQIWQKKKRKIDVYEFPVLDGTQGKKTFLPLFDNANDRPCLERLVKSRNLAAMAT